MLLEWSPGWKGDWTRASSSRPVSVIWGTRPMEVDGTAAGTFGYPLQTGGELHFHVSEWEGRCPEFNMISSARSNKPNTMNERTGPLSLAEIQRAIAP